MQSGIVPGIILFFVITGLSLHCCSVVSRLMDMCKLLHGDNYSVTGFEDFDIGHRWFQVCVNFIVNLDFVFGATITISMMAVNLDEAISYLAKDESGIYMSGAYYRYIVGAISLLLLPIVWIKHFNGLAKISFLGTIANFVVMGIIVTDAIIAISGDYPQLSDVKRPWFNSGIFDGIGTMTYLYGVASMMPSFRDDMKKPNDLGKVVSSVHTMCVITYIGITVMSIWAYGDSVGYVVSQSFVVPAFKIVVACCVSLSLFSSTALYLVPPGLEVEAYFQKKKSKTRELTIRLIGRTCILIFAGGIAMISPRIDLLFNFVGSVTTTSVQTTFPQVFLFLMHRKMKRAPAHIREKYQGVPWWVWAVAAFAFAWGLFTLTYGIYDSIRILVKALNDVEN